MQLEIDGKTYWFVGDPHLGRDFRNGTPLHRRGEREAQQLQRFKDELAAECDINVMVGDLFEKPFVPLGAINEAAHAYVAAAQARPETTFIVMAGNHDLSRQLDVRGAFDILALAISWLPNVIVVTEPYQLYGVGYFPWEWGRTAIQQLEGFDRIIAAVGHYDLMDFGGDTSHMVPAAELAALGCEKIVSGHYHLEGEYEIAGQSVLCTGSLEPYTHAEDPTGELYVTLTVEEALARDDLRDKCVRILLQPGEEMPEIDCLQLTRKRADVEAEEIEIQEIGVGNFDIHAVLEKEFTENEVPAEVRTFIKERMGAVA